MSSERDEGTLVEHLQQPYPREIGVGEKKCDHGVTFDVEEAKRILVEGKLQHPEGTDPMVAFIMGDPNTENVRKRFPRLCGLCPKGCGYNGIAYASMDHYLYGDW